MQENIFILLFERFGNIILFSVFMIFLIFFILTEIEYRGYKINIKRLCMWFMEELICSVWTKRIIWIILASTSIVLYTGRGVISDISCFVGILLLILQVVRSMVKNIIYTKE